MARKAVTTYYCEAQCEAEARVKVAIPNDPTGVGYRRYCEACYDVFLVGVATGRALAASGAPVEETDP